MDDADDPEIKVTHLGGAYDEDRSFHEAPWSPTTAERFFADLDPATYFENDPAVQGTMAHLAAEMNLPPRGRILAIGSPDDPSVDFTRVFQGRSRIYVGDAIEGVPTQADLDQMTRIKGISNALVWTDEMEEPVRDEKAEEARRRVEEQEAFDRHEKTQQMLASMNRADRRRWLRENRPR